MKTCLQTLIKEKDLHLKVQLWQHVQRGNLEMFPFTEKWHDVNTAPMCEVIGKYLKTLLSRSSHSISPQPSQNALTWLGTHTAYHQLLERT